MAKKIILVHGLGGTKDGTWGEFPNLLKGDSDVGFDVLLLGYESPSLWKFWRRAPSVLNIANGIITEIKTNCDLENDEIILVGHSLGGIVIKKVLLLLQNQQISNKIFKVCFFDVPHDGSGYANVGKYLSFRNRHLKSLTRDSSELDDISDQWIANGLNNSLTILSVICANDDIVSSSSSKSIFREHEVVTINNVDHITIVKPQNEEYTSYKVLRKFILEKKTVARYKSLASRNLEDWKSVERNHSYHYVSDEARKNDFEALTTALDFDGAIIRLTGASGLGKTRLLLRAIEFSDNIDDACVLIFNASGYETIIKESIRELVEDRVHCLVIIENCNVNLHELLAIEVKKTDCSLKLVTVDYSNEQVDNSIHIKLSPLNNDSIKQILLPILVGMDSSEVDRVAQFAQGYPLMATLIAEQYQKEGKLLGSIESSSIVRKLIDGHGGITDAEKEMLSACSLFDVFGAEEGTAGEEAKYIAENVAGLNLKTFDKVLRKFTHRQIINRAGRYARLVPKPLAVTLASEWWNEASYERQKQLIDTMPDSLMQSFCTQASYLDDQPSVKRFSDQLFGEASPFVQAEALLTEKGSKLFRAFVEVNRESTSNALYNILSTYSHKDLEAIDGNTRRNLVWGLEKLCFHADVFEKSAWCMLLLASAENESWSNNATGMFAQLFQVNLSGTQANPKVRFDVLKRAIDTEDPNIDMVVLEALRQAIDTYGGIRTVGAEYQGTKAGLEEWRPELWQQVFDFWNTAFDLMIVLLERGDTQKAKVLFNIGNSIRGFVSQGRIEMLDTAIKKIVDINGRYWPAALTSIKNTLKYDSEGMNQEITEMLNSWLTLLSPQDSELPEKLKIIVTNPPWEHHQDENNKYIDVAAENAKALATELSNNIEELLPHISILLQGDQKQSYSFGYQLAYELTDIIPLIDLAFECLVSIEQPDTRLILGLYKGLFEQSPKLWQENIDRLVSDSHLVHFYPDFIRTGNIQKVHLDTFLKLIQDEILSPDSANVLSYGSVTNGVEPHIIANFCLQLSKLGEQASWTALNVIYMYCFSNANSIKELDHTLKQLVVAVPIDNRAHNTHIDIHHWHDLAKKLMTAKDSEFAVALSDKIISASDHGLHHGDIWSFIKPLMLNLMKDYCDTLWPLFSKAIIQADGKKRYWLKQLLGRTNSLVQDTPSVLSVVPVRDIMNWCEKHPDVAPVFTAQALNILETVDDKLEPTQLFLKLLENFGDNQRVTDSLKANMNSRGWVGSLIPYLESDKAALIPFIDHENINIRLWIRNHISYINRQIDEESRRDEEHGFGLY